MSDSGIDDFSAVDDLTLYEGMARAARLGRIVAVHAENDTITRERCRARDCRGAAPACATISPRVPSWPSWRPSSAPSSSPKRPAAPCISSMSAPGAGSRWWRRRGSVGWMSVARPAPTIWSSPRRMSSHRRAGEVRAAHPSAAEQRPALGLPRRWHAADGGLGPFARASEHEERREFLPRLGRHIGLPDHCCNSCSPRAITIARSPSR